MNIVFASFFPSYTIAFVHHSSISSNQISLPCLDDGVPCGVFGMDVGERKEPQTEE